jgi:hypothetical protein
MSAETIFKRNSSIIHERLDKICAELATSAKAKSTADTNTTADADAAPTSNPVRDNQSSNAIGKLSRLFEDVKLSEKDDLTDFNIAVNYEKSAKHIPVLSMCTDDKSRFEQAKKAIANTIEFKAWVQKTLDHAVMELFNADGTLKKSVRKSLGKEQLAKIETRCESESINKQLLAGYMMTFNQAIINELYAEKMSSNFPNDADEFTNPLANGVSLLAQHINHITQTNEIKLATLSTQAYQRRNEKLLRQYRWTQYCLKHIKHHKLRFTLAVRQLNLAVNDALGSDATEDRKADLYAELAKSNQPIIVKKSQVDTAMRLIKPFADQGTGMENYTMVSGMSLYFEHAVLYQATKKQTPKRVVIESKEFRLDNYNSDHRNYKKHMRRVKCKQAIYSAWRNDSYRSWRWRWSLCKVDRAVKSYERFRRKNPGKLDDCLEKLLVIQQLLQRWIEAQTAREQRCPDSKTRLNSAFKLQKDLSKEAQGLEKILYADLLAKDSLAPAATDINSSLIIETAATDQYETSTTTQLQTSKKTQNDKENNAINSNSENIDSNDKAIAKQPSLGS